MATNVLAKTKKYNPGAQHFILTFSMIAVFFALIFYYLIPSLISGFVLPLFEPNPENLKRMGFVKFDGLVWASTPLDIANEAKGKPISAKLNNKEFVFDFTWSTRNEADHGYVKKSNEWYTKSQILGESAIILEPYVGFTILALVMAFALTMVLTMFMPSGIGLMAVLFEKQIEETKVKLRIQTGFADEIIEYLIMPDEKLKEKEISDVRHIYRMVWERTTTEDITSAKQTSRFEDIFDADTDIVFFRNQLLYSRIKEFFSDFLVKEIEDLKHALLWRKNRANVMKGFKLYMSHHFTEKYSNMVTGLAYGGAAVLIVAVGIRGLKFIPAVRPSLILLAITLEFSMLLLMALTLVYTEEEERMDKMLKKMEDANRSQLEALRGQQADIHQLANALVGQTAEIIRNRVKKAIEDYMTNGDNVQKMVAEEIANKILFSLREEKQQAYRQPNANR